MDSSSTRSMNGASGPHDPIRQEPVAPVAYQVIVEPGIGQFREFDFPRVHTRMNSWGLFLGHKLTCGKREREREFETLDENRRAVGLLNSLRDKN